MNDPEFVASKLEFVKTLDNGYSKWREPDGTTIDLHPTVVLRSGLMDKMRAALAEEAERGVVPAPPHVEGLEPYPVPEEPPVSQETHVTGTLVGGFNDDWRWDYVRDGDDVWLCIDNQPAIDRYWRENPDRHKVPHPPDLQRAVVPLDLLQQIVRVDS